jgi:hypothetical protein
MASKDSSNGSSHVNPPGHSVTQCSFLMPRDLSSKRNSCIRPLGRTSRDHPMALQWFLELRQRIQEVGLVYTVEYVLALGLFKRPTPCRCLWTLPSMLTPHDIWSGIEGQTPLTVYFRRTMALDCWASLDSRSPIVQTLCGA